MRKILKTAIVLTVLVTLLASPITVCAVGVSEVIQESENTKQVQNDITMSEPEVAEQDAASNDIISVETVEQAPIQNDIIAEETTEQDTSSSDTAPAEIVEQVPTSNDIIPEEEAKQDTESNDAEPVETVEQAPIQNDITPEEATEKDTSSSETLPIEMIEQDIVLDSIQVDLQSDDIPVQTRGKLELEIILRLPTEEKFVVSLQKDNETAASTQEKYDDRLYYNFDNLKSGTYTLRVDGKNYVAYTQMVEIGNDVTKIVLSNGHDINDAFAKTQTKYGVVGLGDITDNGIINEADENLMIEKIEAGTYEEKYDLNKDGKIDIIDLSYIVFNHNENIRAVPIKMLKLTEENVELKGTKRVAGQVASIFENNNDSVSLQPLNGQDISANNPVELELDLGENEKTTEAIVISPPKEQDNAIQQAKAVIAYLNSHGEMETLEVTIGGTSIAAIYSKEPIQLASLSETAIASAQSRSAATATVQSDGSILIDLGGQIAIKKVTIRITQTASNKLADIAKVEFLNDMESRIPEPEMDIPENVTAVPGSEKFIVHWKKMANVTGYEVEVSVDGKTEVLKTEANNITVSRFAGGKVKNGTTYTVRVQSTNGDWRSGYSNTVTVTPQPNKKPDPPDNLSVTGGYKLLKASWKNMDSTDSYNVYYREYGVGDYIKVAQNITTNSYTITGLKDKTRYQVYVTGSNRIGEGNPSLVSTAETTDLNPPITTNYQLINRPIQGEAKTEHIAGVSYQGGVRPESEFAIVDNNYETSWYINSWDAGGYNSGKPSPIVEFDATYKIGKVIVVADETQTKNYAYGNTRYWDENGNVQMISGQFSKKTSSNGKAYYQFEYSKPIDAKKIQISFALDLAYSNVKISIAEMKFYEWDEIKDEIAGLFTDQLCVTLRDDVTEDTIKAIENKINTIEEISGEYNPNRAIYQKELDTAREILNNKELKQAIKIDTAVSTAYDSHITFRGGLNAWQPLGVVGYGGEKIIVYVGNPSLNIGDNTSLQLIATQYHAESGKWQSTVKTLKVGRNEIEIPKIGSLDYEKRRLFIH